MREKALKRLGLMRRANAIRPGEDRAGEAVQAGRARLMLLASDAADNARRRAEHLVNGRRTLLLELPFAERLHVDIALVEERGAAGRGAGGRALALRELFLRELFLRGNRKRRAAR